MIAKLFDSKAILVDLDGTLFDHHHSLRSAIKAVQRKFDYLSKFDLADLIDKYNSALQTAYDAYLRKEISYEETDTQKIQLFFADLGLPQPSEQEVHDFRETYRPAYRESRRATPGSIECLCRLLENGYRLVIVTNGQAKDQTAKAKFIGVGHLVEKIITSEEVGVAKPHPDLFKAGATFLGVAPECTIMLGDSVEADLEGAINAKMQPVLYAPLSTEGHTYILGQRIPTIHHMGLLPGLLDIELPAFQPRISTIADGTIMSIQGLGIDLVTAERHCLRMPSELVEDIGKGMGFVLEATARGMALDALRALARMMISITEAATAIDATKVQIAFTGKDDDSGDAKFNPTSSNNCLVTHRPHSVRVEYSDLRLISIAPSTEPALRKITSLLQAHCNELMRDYPRAASRQLRAAMLEVAEVGRVTDLVVAGQGID